MAYEDLPADAPRAARYQPTPPPPGLGLLGMRLFLTSLFMLFAAAIVGYLFIRLAGPKSPQSGALHIPKILWLSTVIVITVSVAMARALAAVRRERQQLFVGWTWAAMILAIAFIAVQTPAMIELLIEHHRLVAGGGTFLYGLIFVLILLHALHVLGGMVALGRVLLGAHQGKFDHENANPVRFAAMYWHFLDLVWIVMFLTLLLTA